MASSQKYNTTTFILFIIIITTITVASYLYYQPNNISNKPLNNENIALDANDVINETKTIETLKKEQAKPLFNPKFPQCYTQIEYSTLSEILYDYHIGNNVCVGQKCSNKTKKIVTSKETTGLIVVYVAVCLLLISLGAAFLELIKAKKEPVKNKTKPELTRACSLADLTVLRHNRRESMVRRDSTLTIDESTKKTSLKMIGRKMSRPRLRVT